MVVGRMSPAGRNRFDLVNLAIVVIVKQTQQRRFISQVNGRFPIIGFNDLNTKRCGEPIAQQRQLILNTIIITVTGLPQAAFQSGKDKLSAFSLGNGRRRDRFRQWQADRIKTGRNPHLFLYARYFRRHGRQELIDGKRCLVNDHLSRNATIGICVQQYLAGVVTVKNNSL